MATAPPTPERIASVPVFFEGSYRGASPVTQRNGAQAVAKDGQPLVAVRLLMGNDEHESLQQITLRRADIPENIPLGEYVRIPGSVSVTKRGERVYVSRWGNAVLWASADELAPAPEPINVGAELLKRNGASQAP